MLNLEVYNPPRSFKDFSSSNLASTDVCCDCGGGVDCSDKPFETWLGESSVALAWPGVAAWVLPC